MTDHSDKQQSQLPGVANIEIGHLLTQIGKLSDAIRTEFDLVTARMGWLVTAEAFISAAFVAAATAFPLEKGAFLSLLTYLVFALPLLGIVLAFTVLIAIQAAHTAAERLKEDRDKIMQQLPEGLRIVLVASRDPEHLQGNLPARILPPTIIIFWIIALFSLPMPKL